MEGSGVKNITVYGKHNSNVLGPVVESAAGFKKGLPAGVQLGVSVSPRKVK
jgi:hypothetical protein